MRVGQNMAKHCCQCHAKIIFFLWMTCIAAPLFKATFSNIGFTKDVQNNSMGHVFFVSLLACCFARLMLQYVAIKKLGTTHPVRWKSKMPTNPEKPNKEQHRQWNPTQFAFRGLCLVCVQLVVRFCQHRNQKPKRAFACAFAKQMPWWNTLHYIIASAHNDLCNRKEQICWSDKKSQTGRRLRERDGTSAQYRWAAWSKHDEKWHGCTANEVGYTVMMPNCAKKRTKDCTQARSKYLHPTPNATVFEIVKNKGARKRVWGRNSTNKTIVKGCNIRKFGGRKNGGGARTTKNCPDATN